MRLLAVLGVGTWVAGALACSASSPTGDKALAPHPGIESEGPKPSPLPLEARARPRSLDGGVEAACAEFLPNDTLEEATDVAPGVHRDLAICAGERDVYRLEVPAGAVLTASIRFQNSQGDLDLYLTEGRSKDLGDGGTTLVMTDSAASGTLDEEQILNVPYAKATPVYLMVSPGKEGASGPYELDIAFHQAVKDRDCFSDCTTQQAMPGATSWASPEAKEDGYFVYTPREYAFPRTDMLHLIRYAARAVNERFPATRFDPVALGDICQADGKTPGVDRDSPRHPTTTHVRGKDIDIAYYQTDGMSNYGIICGDGTDTNNNGRPGKFNDGYFCTTEQNVVDIPRLTFFLSKLAESPMYRVLGVDQTLVKPIQAEALRLFQAKEIGPRQYERLTEDLGYGAAGGWQFHHHHFHLSLFEYR